jgi:hypothetical protein
VGGGRRAVPPLVGPRERGETQAGTRLLRMSRVVQPGEGSPASIGQAVPAWMSRRSPDQVGILQTVQQGREGKVRGEGVGSLQPTEQVAERELACKQLA